MITELAPWIALTVAALLAWDVLRRHQHVQVTQRGDDERERIQKQMDREFQQFEAIQKQMDREVQQFEARLVHALQLGSDTNQQLGQLAVEVKELVGRIEEQKMRADKNTAAIEGLGSKTKDAFDRVEKLLTSNALKGPGRPLGARGIAT